jgi:hypothetical protein
VLINIQNTRCDGGVICKQLTHEISMKPERLSPLRLFAGNEHGDRQQQEIDGSPKNADWETGVSSAMAKALNSKDQTPGQQSKYY